jgi:hypothetical protein
LLLTILVALLGAAAPAPAQEARESAQDTVAVDQDTVIASPDDGNIQIRFKRHGRGVFVDVEDDRVRSADIVRFGESIEIEKGERVAGDVVAIGGGGITVDGEVRGDVVAIGAPLELGPGAKVDGEVVCIGSTLTLGTSSEVGLDAMSVWGRVEADSGAVVHGQLTEVGGLKGMGFPGVVAFGREEGFAHDLKRLVTRLVWVLCLIGLGILAFHLFPDRMRRLSDTVTQRGLITFLAGMAGWVLWLPAFLLLCVTIVGIPVALLLLVFTPIMMLLGYLAVAAVAGERLRGRFFGPGDVGIGKTLVVGVFALEGAVIASRLFGTIGSFFDFLGLILAVLGYCVIFVAVTMGFGSFLMTRFRRMQAPPAAAPTVAAVPPSPPAPIAPYRSESSG